MRKENIPQRYKDAILSEVKELANIGTEESLYLFGTVGCGKTHGLYALANQRFIQEKKVEVVSFESLMRDIRSTFRGNGRLVSNGESYYNMTEERIIDKFSKCPWLGIDDLGSSRTDAEASAFTLSVVYEIVNNRYSDKLPLVVTTNKNLSALGREFDARIMSRIKGMCKVLEFKGSDRRQ